MELPDDTRQTEKKLLTMEESFTGRKHKISADQSDAGRPETGTERADRKSHGTVPTERTFCKKNVSGTPCVIHRWRQKNERSQKYIGRI